MGDPGPSGRFGEFGGRFVPESLVPACIELEAAFRDGLGRPGLPGRARRHPAPLRRPTRPRSPSATGCRTSSGSGCCSSGRTWPTPARTSSTTWSARRCWPGGWASSRLIAETGAGQHGVATATAAALFGMECVVYMGEVDTQRQELNVFRMELLGAEVRAGDQREPDAEGRGQRGAAGLGGLGGRHPLLPGIGDGPPSLPVDGPGVPAGHRRRGPGAVPGAARRRRPRRGGGLRRRRLQRRRDLRRVRRRHRVGAGGGGGGRRARR